VASVLFIVIPALRAVRKGPVVVVHLCWTPVTDDNHFFILRFGQRVCIISSVLNLIE
jgi:hypothetical protein